MNHKNIKAKKKLGQNFLQDENILKIISESTEIENQNIIEVGPGYGALTKYILEKKPKLLQVIELDLDMINILQKDFEAEINKNLLEINHIDVLKFFPEIENYNLIANIPYYITSPILRHFLYEVSNFPNEMIIMMQKEVGEKILSEKSSFLSLIIKHKAEVSEVCKVPRIAFFPIPKVDSIVLKFKLKKSENNKEFDAKFVEFLNECFKWPRKTLVNNLANKFDSEKILKILKELGFEKNVRAEEIDLENIKMLFHIVNEYFGHIE